MSDFPQPVTRGPARRHATTAPMRLLTLRQTNILAHPWDFLARTVKAFRANQGLLLAGAVAYYALLSVVPLLILTVIALSHVIAQDELLSTLGPVSQWC
jgi:membrane protein